MKKIALLVACALLGLTACSNSSSHSSTKETTAIADHKEDEAEADKAEPEIEETEPATEPETEADQKKGLDITSLTIGDETIYLEYCTVADVVKFLQKAGYSVDTVKLNLTVDVEPYGEVRASSLGSHAEGGRDSIYRLFHYNPTGEICKVADCKISLLEFKYIDDRLSFVNGTLTSDMLYRSKEDIVNFLSSIPDTVDYGGSNYVEKPLLEYGQLATLKVGYSNSSEKLVIELPYLYE